MLSHIIICATDLERLGRSYGAVLASLGLWRDPELNEPDGGPDGIVWTLPGRRPRYAADDYGAYARDPEGHKLCFVHAGGLAAIAFG